ncbi:MAG: STAS domain-containing protein [Oliverpabstia sp.]
MSNMDYRALVNPTFNTAQQTLYMLAAAHNEDAICYIKEMGIKNGLEASRQAAHQENSIFTEQEGKDLMTGVILGIECRYESLTRLIKESGIKNVFDIACGYTPRALTVKKMGLDYIGLDVPVVAEQMAAFAAKLFPQTSHPVYIGGDATNAASLDEAAEKMEGELFITSEGLLQYLSKNELIQMIQGIRKLLLKHGGAWYSSDMEVAYDKISAVNIGNPDALRRFAQARNALADKTDIYFESASFQSTEDKMHFFEEHGLKVEKVPFYVEGQHLNTMMAIAPEKQEKLKALLKSFSIWKMVPDENYAAKKSACIAESVDHLSIRYQEEDGILYCTLEGRVDTLSAPELLKVFEETAANTPLKAMEIDAQKLEYISSAGLRVLMIAVKRMGSGSVSVLHASETIKDIFETTGFDTMIQIR